MLQYVVGGLFAALAVGFWIFQVAQHEKFAEMAENNHLRRLPLPAPRGVLFDRDGKVLVENRNIFNIALVREQTKNIDETLHTLAAGDRAPTRRSCATRSTGAARAELSADRADRERDAGTGRRRPGATVGAARDRCYAGSAVAPLSRERDGGAPVRLRRRGQRGPAAAAGIPGRRSGRHRRPGGHREGLQRAADGRRTAPSASSSTASAAKSGRSTSRTADRRQAAAADDRRRRAEGDRGRLHGVRASTARRSCSIRATAKCSASPAGRPTTRTRSRPASIARRGRR